TRPENHPVGLGITRGDAERERVRGKSWLCQEALAIDGQQCRTGGDGGAKQEIPAGRGHSLVSFKNSRKGEGGAFPRPTGYSRKFARKYQVLPTSSPARKYS